MRLSLDGILQLERRATETRDVSAILAPGRAPLTYSGLWSHLGNTRRWLRGAGVQPGEAVAMVMGQGPELITAFLAVADESACAPLNPSLTEEEYRGYLSRLGARHVLVQDGVALPAANAARALGRHVLRILPALDQAAGTFTLNPGENQATGRAGRQTVAVLLLFTSATTGSPKLVPLTCSNLHAMTLNNARAFQLSSADRLLVLMPLFHLHELDSVLTQIFCGGTVIIPPAFEAAGFPTWLEEFRPTWLTGGPPLLRAVLALASEHREIFRQVPLRFIQSTGGALELEPRSLLEEAVGSPLLDGYGMTEIGGITRSTFDGRKQGSAGRSSGAEIAILDESGTVLPPEAEGEITVRGPALTAGYLDDPEANRAAFRDGWFRTGDRGRLDREGFLFITGRHKEIVNRGGEKILPWEVDEALGKHPAVKEAAVFGIPHPTLGEEVAAAVILRQGAAATELELRRSAATHLAAFKVPRRILFVNTIPKGPTGKPKRNALSEQYRNVPRDRSAEPAEAPPPVRAIEAVLAGIWTRILGTAQIGVQDDFFGLGGDSLSAALMLAEVQRVLKADPGLWNPVEFFDQPTIAHLGRTLADCGAQAAGRGDKPPAGGPPSGHILPLQKQGSRIPFFCFPASDVDPYYLRHLAKYLGSEQPFYAVRPPEPVAGGRLLRLEELARLSIAVIRTIRPHGPYLIGGHCYGGVIAFEAALQLLSEGQDVAQLVLFDAPTPGYPKVARAWRRYLAEAFRVLAGLARGELPPLLREAPHHVRTLSRVVGRKFTGRASRALSSVGSDALVTGRRQKELNGMALWEYAPRDFPAPMVQFIAADEPVSTRVLDDPRYGWREFARGGLELRTARGDHNSMFGAVEAPALAAQLAAVLERAASCVPTGTQ